MINSGVTKDLTISITLKLGRLVGDCKLIKNNPKGPHIDFRSNEMILIIIGHNKLIIIPDESQEQYTLEYRTLPRL